MFVRRTGSSWGGRVDGNWDRLSPVSIWSLWLLRSLRKKSSAIIWKPLSSDRSDNDRWDRTFYISVIVVSAIMMKRRRRASHLGRFTLWHNGRRVTQLGRFTLWHNGRRNFWKIQQLAFKRWTLYEDRMKDLSKRFNDERLGRTNHHVS